MVHGSRAPDPRLQAPVERGRDHLPDRTDRARGGGLPRALGVVREGLRQHSRPHRSCDPCLPGLQPAGTTTGRLPAAPPAARRTPLRHRHGAGQLHRQPAGAAPSAAGAAAAQTLRSHDQYNTTVYGLDDRYRGIHQGRRVLFVHLDDLSDRSLADGDLVDIVSEYDDCVKRRARLPRGALPDASRLAAYFPETNVLVPLDSTAAVSNTPTSKSIVVRLEQVPAVLSTGI